MRCLCCVVLKGNFLGFKRTNGVKTFILVVLVLNQFNSAYQAIFKLFVIA